MSAIPAAARSLLRTTPTIAPVPRRAVLSITGEHALEYLKGIVAGTVPESPHNHFFTAFLQAQGRVLHDAFIHSSVTPTDKNEWLVEYDSTPSDAPPFLPMLKRYVLRSKVRLRDVTEEYGVWAAWGSEAEQQWETRRKWQHSRSGAVEPVWDPEAEWPWGDAEGPLQDRRAVGMGSRRIVRKGDKPLEASTHDVATSDDYTRHRILHGVPEGSTDIVPDHAFPMDSNLDLMGALDFRKGCYVGQELTVRTYHTGIVRKRTFPVLLKHGKARAQPESFSVAPGTDIRVRADRPAADGAPSVRPRGTGKLLSSIDNIGLALLRLEHVDAVEKKTSSFFIDTGDGSELSIRPWHPKGWPKLSTGSEPEAQS